MHESSFSPAAPSVRRMSLLGAAALLATSMSALAATQIDVWHSLNSHNADVFEGLVKKFNRQSKDVTVRLKAFDDANAVGVALSTIKKDAERPHLVQLDEIHLPDMAAHRSYIQPLHVLLARHPIKGADWYLPAGNSALRDAKGRLQAFPFMLDIPVMFYNTEAFKKAGITPAQPKRSWAELQGQVVTAANNGSRRCPITSDQPVSINLENLAAVNNQPFVSQAKGAPLFRFDSLYIRHLSLMISWVRSELLVKPDFNSVASQRFANGECAILLSQSSNLGWFASQRGLDFGVSGLPFYPEVTQTPGLPFVSGSALWITGGHAESDDAATAAFLAWLAQPDQASEWYEHTGFLPLTKQAFAQAGGSGKAMEQWKSLVQPYASEPVATSRGFQIKNYPEIKALFQQAMDKALSGQEPAVTALKSASDQASKIGSGK